MSARLAGRTAIISGGARGQGAAHGRRLAEEGAAVILGDVLEEAGEAHAAALREAGLDVRFRHLDVTSPADWDAAVRRRTRSMRRCARSMSRVHSWRGTSIRDSGRDPRASSAASGAASRSWAVRNLATSRACAE